MIKSFCGSFSFVRKKKRLRVFRYKKILFIMFFGLFFVFGESDEELEVVECLILLFKSSFKDVVNGKKFVGEVMDVIFERFNGYLRSKKVRKVVEFEYGFLSNE